MFARKLIDAPQLRMWIDWFGIGRLEVFEPGTGRHAIATPALKSHFINTVDSLQRRGVSMTPNNPILERAFLAYANAMLNPESMLVRTMLLDHPHDLAYRIIHGIE